MPRATKRRGSARLPSSTKANGIAAEPHAAEQGRVMTLPPELLRNIVEEVASSLPEAKLRNHALFNLLLASWAFHAEAQRVLYHEVTFVNGTPAAGRISDALDNGAAKYVRSFRVEGYNDSASGRHGRSSNMHFHYIPLHKMQGLRSLSICGEAYRKNLKLFEFLNASLDENILVSFRADADLNLEALPFLKRQRNIRSLFLLHIDPSLESFPCAGVLPVLRYLRVRSLPVQLSIGYFQDRPITALRVDTFWWLPQSWREITAQLTSLDLSRATCPKHVSDVLINQGLLSALVNLRLFASYTIVYRDGELFIHKPRLFRT